MDKRKLSSGVQKATKSKNERMEENVVDDERNMGLLPDDVLIKIISYLPTTQWASLERVNKAFQRNVYVLWKRVKNIRLDEDLAISFKHLRDRSEPRRQENFRLIMEKLVLRTPNIRSLGGFQIFETEERGIEIFTDDFIRQMSRFAFLDSISFADAHLFFGTFFLVGKLDLTTLLEIPAIRGRLKKLDLIGCFRHTEIEMGNERMVRAFGGNPNLPPLQLETFLFGEKNARFEFLESIDASLLTKLNIHHYSDDIVPLITRSVNLQYLDCSLMWHAGGIPFDQQISDHQKLLEAIGGCQNILSLKLYSQAIEETYCCYDDDFNDHLDVLRPNLVDLIRKFGRHHQFTELSLLHNHLCGDDIVAAIANYLTNLTTLELHIDICTEPAITHLVTKLNQLKKLQLISTPYTHQYKMVTNDVISALTANLIELESLHLSYPPIYPNMRDDIVRLTKLKELSFMLFSKEAEMIWVEALGSQLESLGIDHWKRPIDEALIEMLKKINRLHRLSLKSSACSKYVCDLATIVPHCPFLRELDLSGYYDAWKDDVQFFIDQCPDLKRVITLHKVDRVKLKRYRSVSLMGKC